MSLKDIKAKLHQCDKREIHTIMNKCEVYRQKLIEHCRLHFGLDTEDAYDCVQYAYTSLYESLLNGTEIKNYRAWLYKVAINHKNKLLREQEKRNEYDFSTTEEKDKVIENALSYNPDYVENIISDYTIEKRAVEIISSLDENDRKLYIDRYIKKKTFVEIGSEMGLDPSTVRKRHDKMRKKIIKKVKEYTEE